MPIESSDLDGGVGLLIEYSGVLTDEEYVAFYSELLNRDPAELGRYRYNITDFLGVTELKLSSETIRWMSDLAKTVAAANPDVAIAIVTDTDVIFGLSRMWAIMMDDTGWDIMVFREKPPAEDWVRETTEKRFGIRDLALA